MTEHPSPPTDPRADGDRYLWDRRGVPDPHVQHLEQALAPLRLQAAPPAPPRRIVGARLRPLAMAAGVVLVAAIAWLIFGVTRGPRPGWDVQSVEGLAMIGDRPLGTGDRLGEGDWLRTPADARVRLDVDHIGSVTVHPESFVRLARSRAGEEYRLQLERGRIEAFITAPPRLFFVETPAAVAVDLGCAYELEVDESGDGVLEVVMGWVALEWNRIISTVPAGAACRIRSGHGPGTPYFLDAPEALRRSLELMDFNDAAAAALEVVLQSSRPRDALTLWHLLPRRPAAERRAIVDRMIALAGRPEDVTAEATVALDPDALDAWWSALQATW